MDESKTRNILGVFMEMKWENFLIFLIFRNAFHDLGSVWYLMIVSTVKNAKTPTASVKFYILHRRNQVGSFVGAASSLQ